MRDLINLTKLLFEAQEPTTDELASMKSVIAAKIKELPNDDATAKTLKEIEDLLAHLHAGGRLGIISKELTDIKDPTVTAAQQMLSRYILSIGMTPDQRNELFKLWKEDKLVDRKKLLQSGKKTFNEVITSYDTNPGIKELADELMRIQALGQGKGEFAFSVMSKSIAKPAKGDLIIDGTKVEVKTTEGGAGRFTDQEVRPGEGFEKAARDLNAFVTQHPETPATLPKSGLSLGAAVKFANTISNVDEFIELVKTVINKIFDNSDTAAVDRICDAIKAGNIGAATQEYAKLSFNYYIGKKDDDGVLYINLTKDPIVLVWFTDADDLAASGMRLHASTIYLTSIADVRLPYPQMDIVDTSAGTGSAAEPTVASKASSAKQAAIQQKIADIDKPTTGIRPPGTVRAPRDATAAATQRQRR